MQKREEWLNDKLIWRGKIAGLSASANLEPWDASRHGLGWNCAVPVLNPDPIRGRLDEIFQGNGKTDKALQ